MAVFIGKSPRQPVSRRGLLTGAGALAAYAALQKSATAASDNYCPTTGIFNPVFNPAFPGCSEFVLDQLSAYPEVAYSVRQLTSGIYARPYCMLVRRSSDNAQQNIGYVNGWLDIVSLLAFCGSGSGYVVTWYNQGSLGSSGDATQSTAASQPQIVASGVVETQNGVPTVYFGGSQSMASSGNIGITGAEPSLSNIVCSYASTSGAYYYFLAHGTAGNAQARALGRYGYQYILGVSFENAFGGSATVNQLVIESATMLSPYTTVSVNGISFSPLNQVLTTGNSLVYLGQWIAGGQNATGNLSEAIIQATNSPSDKTTLELSQACAFNIPGVIQ